MVRSAVANHRPKRHSSNCLPLPKHRCPAQIRSDLKKEKKASFEQTATYQEIGELFKAKYKKDPTYAIMPQVVISSAKMKQDKNTNWYATNVDRRYKACMTLADKLGK